MQRMYKRLVNQDDPVELRKAEDRMRYRLRQLGYRLQKGKTVKPGKKGKPLKRLPVERGYRISSLATGRVLYGSRYEMSYNQVNAFWEAKVTERVRKQQWDERVRMVKPLKYNEEANYHVQY